jgi:hypothetical protein
MDGWVVGWVVGWVDGWMDGWMDGRIDYARRDNPLQHDNMYKELCGSLNEDQTLSKTWLGFRCT